MGKTLSPIKAIRKKCLDCSGESPAEVRECPVRDCILFPFRFGMMPKTAKRKGKDV